MSFRDDRCEIVNEIPGRHSARPRLPTRSSIMLLVFIPVSSTFSFPFFSFPSPPLLIPALQNFPFKRKFELVHLYNACEKNRIPFKKKEKKILDSDKTDFIRSYTLLHLHREFLNEIDGKNFHRNLSLEKLSTISR